MPEYRQGYIDTFQTSNVLRAYREGTESLRYEFLISNDGRNYYWMRITARIFRLEDGSIHMLVYRQNIEAEKQRQEDIELSLKAGLNAYLVNFLRDKRSYRGSERDFQCRFQVCCKNGNCREGHPQAA